MNLTAVLLLATGLASGAPAEQPKLLNIGDPAPEFKVARWIKGEPIEELAKGKIYVIEFWATWCGPCRQLMPHVTELAGKYQGKATFVGVSILENKEAQEEEVLERVAKFVKAMGDRIGYRIAADGAANFMGNRWFKASMEKGIPSTFIVGPDGKIAWIGHPTEVGPILDEMLKGSFDSTALALRRRKEKEGELRDQKIMGILAALVKQKKFKEAVAEVDKTSAEYPEYKNRLGLLRFHLLLRADETKAYPYARELTEGIIKENPAALYQVAVAILEPADLKKPDLDLALACAQKANELTEFRSPMWQATLAAAHFKKGDPAKAVEVMEKAIQQADRLANFPEDGKKLLQKKLSDYTKAEKAPAKQ